jgi:YidC/Oxa1 family membrane protein insertase
MQVQIREFYQLNKVNPFGSCLPILLQLPIFFALFFVLQDFSKDQKRGEDYVDDASLSFLWDAIPDITVAIDSVGWVGWAMIAFYVASQMFASRVMATTPDPKQRMIMMILPLVFVPFIVNFPVGLLLYWITTNLFTLAHHVVVVRMTDTSGEVVLPQDSKGRSKVITPKSEKRKQQAKERDGDTAKSGSGDAGASRSTRARKNKRRK